MSIGSALEYLSREAEEAEIYFMREDFQNLELEREDIRLVQAGELRGYGIRVIAGSRQGFCHSQELNREALEMALKNARVAGKNENLCLPVGESYQKVEHTYDSRIQKLEAEEARDYLVAMVAEAQNYKVDVATGGISWNTHVARVYNTNGIEVEDCGSSISANMSTVARRGREVSSGLYYEASRSLNLDFESIAGEAASLAKGSLGAKRVKKGDYSVILKPMAVVELLENVLVPAFSADNVQRQRSMLHGKIGEKVFGELSITDDGTLEGGLFTARMDGEGSAMRRKELVEGGVVKEFLYDCYTAKKEGRESNGSASRVSYSALPRIDASNFIISGKESSSCSGELEVSGLIGAHTSNPVTGDFSLEVRNAFLKDNPVKKAIISGNIYELMDKVAALGRDAKQYSRVVAPSMTMEGVRVVG